MTRPRRLMAIAVAGIAVIACSDGPPSPTGTADDAPVANVESAHTRAPNPPFVDVAADVGIDFDHFTGLSGQYFFPEIAGAGVALFDADGDGDLDVYLVQGRMLEDGRAPVDAISPPTFDGKPVNRLYRNELIPTGRLAFVDVTDASGADDDGYGMGVAVGDTDNDGDPDLFVSNFGQDRFYANDGDGTFSHVAGAFAVANDEAWTTSASFVDIDLDGDLDLFATHYVGFTMANNIACSGAKGEREYCGPNIYPPTIDRLWRNDGDNVFVDITAQTGIDAAAGAGLGTSVADFDADGLPDIYVANDLMENRLWLQRPDWRFEDTALLSGAAYNADGAAEASMGVTAGDFDADGDEDLFMTHLNAQTNTLYRNDGRGNFVDDTDTANLAAPSLPLTGFGTAWFDYDNDGWLDLFIANGAVTAQSGDGLDPVFPYGQVNQLFRNEGGRFRDLSAIAGPEFARIETGRGAAFGDIDNDGDIDIGLSNGNGPFRLLLNQSDGGHHWLRIRLVGDPDNRDGAGARVAIMRSGAPTLWRRAHTDGSYLSASDIRVHVGLGAIAGIDAIGVVWPGGRRETWSDIPVDTEIVLAQGTGAPWHEP